MVTQADGKDFEILIENNKGIIIKICNSYCNNKNDRADLAQEIIYQLWKSYKNYSSGYKFSTWMYRIALNVAISFYRKGKNTIASIALPENIVNIEDEPHCKNAIEENINLLQQYITQLNDLDKALMILYLEAKSYSEIAEILGITETNVATKINRVKEKLKQKFLSINK